MIKITSFGYGHPGIEPPAAHFTFDLRDLFRDPHVSSELRELTGRDPKVIQSVFRQPGAEQFLNGIVNAVLAVRWQDVVVAFGCVGGRHRSVVFADALALELRARLRRELARRSAITVEHRDIDKPVLVRAVKL